ncbi:DUF4013 domain-containing protein [Blastopirellula marina]|uniref:DUF4013 domain-containing protein n=1 Tax=Blastopirellula marina DSM 3645 TaxID=314230 RepID=A3ZN47_9BACT|nr:DUF4013 domain-containing protein [Blastopirellula marina]EAQ82376.1 hypothetical protein DSM3645_01640 [Blastopirellula marina DSM 3645]
MSNDPSNPFQSPSGDSYQDSSKTPNLPIPSRDSIDYMSAYTKFFEHPEWVNGLLLSSLATIIPIIGGLILAGYEYDNVARTLTGRGERPYSPFTFDRFGEYIMRSLWVFLYGLCCSIVIIPIFIVCMIIMGVLSSLGDGALGVIGGILGFVLYVGTILLLNFAMIPGTLRVALTNDIAQGFDFGYITDFVRKMWIEQILVVLFLTFSSIIVLNIGLLICCIGVIPAMVIAWFAMSQLMMQLYQVYVSRGGKTFDITP